MALTATRGRTGPSGESTWRSTVGLCRTTSGGRVRDEDTLMPSLMAAATGPQGYRGEYSGTRQSASQARHDVEMILSTWHLEHLAPSSSQVIAELMANAVSHCTEQPVIMEMIRTEHGVRICVVDCCQKEPVLREAAPTDEHGRGMFLIAAFASAWDWEFVRVSRRSKPVGKRVWADVVA